MFTGIVSGVASVKTVGAGGVGRYTFACPRGWLRGAEVGDSIAVNGACLTAVDVVGDTFAADISAETVARCAPLAAGDSVNVEQALRVGDKLGGHFVTGHIDGSAQVIAIDQQNPTQSSAAKKLHGAQDFPAAQHSSDAKNLHGAQDLQGAQNSLGAQDLQGAQDSLGAQFRLRPPPRLLPLIAEKGSVAISGVSLTVAAVTDDNFSVALIAHTLQSTNLAAVRVGHHLNLEVDILSRHLHRLTQFNSIPKINLTSKRR